MSVVIAPSRDLPASRARQRGALLLEALIGILIFALGILGLVGLQARALGYASDAQYRAEAAYLANSYISKIWADQPSAYATKYQSAGQPEYDAFKAAVDRLPGASGLSGNPQVTIVRAPPGGLGDPCTLPELEAAGFKAGCDMSLTAGATIVVINIRWLPPAVDESAPKLSDPHNYTVSSVIAVN